MNTRQVSAVPLPPVELAERTLGGRSSDPLADFDSEGAASKQWLLNVLGPGFSFEGKRILDFGCGAGKLLRHLLTEAEKAEIYGCDIDVASIEWLRSHFSPPLHVFANSETPPLAFPDAYFDLIQAGSVFTHLTDHWSSWLVELHRLLTPGGIFVASFMGEAMAERVSGAPWSDDDTGMTVFQYGEDFTDGRQGPMVLHSTWWIREHWGRLFDIGRLFEPPLKSPQQAVVLLRKRDVRLTADELERANPDEPRELASALRQVRQLKLELSHWRFLARERESPVESRRDAAGAADPVTAEPEHRSANPAASPADHWLEAGDEQIAALSQRVRRGAAEPPAAGIGTPRLAARRLMLRLLRPHSAHQTHINHDVVAALASLSEAVRQAVTARGLVPDSAMPPRSDGASAGLDEVPPIHPSESFLIPPRELRVQDDISWWEFFRWPAEYHAYLTLLCNLRRDSCVLEIGCHSGRTMMGLYGYLRPPGRYEGLDISQKHVEYAQSVIHRQAPIFNFTAIDVHHSWFNPSGRLNPASAPFPYPDSTFDVAYAASVFTHTLPDVTENYLRETARVLKPSGRFLFSYLDLDRYDGFRAEGGDTWFDISQRLPTFPGVGVTSAENPDHLVGYSPALLRALAENAGLTVERLLPGTLMDSEPYGVNEQDLMVLRKG